jgi:MEDS: MEthanogen/methylotroph, DcmR Sensory domain
VAVAAQTGSVAQEQRSHVVQFYRRDEELAGAVAEYLAGAVLAGGTAVLVATSPHTAAVTALMEQAGVDLATARRRDRFRSLDAEAMLRQFVRDGRVDRASFDNSIGRLIAEAAIREPVAVYGEMVAVLWAAGDVVAASELEELWNDLAQKVPFWLYCGYPDDELGEDLEARARLCQLHTAVVGPNPDLGPDSPRRWRPMVSRAFECVRDAPRDARHFVMHLLRQWRLDGGAGPDGTGPDGADPDEAGSWPRVITDAALVVTELATNAVLHARSAFTVSVARSGDAVCLSVADSVPLPPGQVGLPVRGDHGLGVIDRIAEQWGIQPVPAGKVIWANLALPA